MRDQATLAPEPEFARGPAAPRPEPSQTTAFDHQRPISRGMSPLPSLEIGYEIDHFRVVRQLGQGGMGRVLLARDTQLGRLVALKLIREDRLDRAAPEAFLTEARMTARLSHPNIVTIHHIGQWQETMYLALEYVEGGTLRERLQGRPLPPREAARIALPIAHALTAAHAALVSHCDLKPENVLVPPDGRLRVVDFGISRVLDNRPWDERAEGHARVAGTPGYMAPEQWAGESSTGAVDLWALGVILYEMLAGHRPFEGPDTDGRPLHRRVLDPDVQPTRLTGVPDELRALVEAMLDRHPAGRPTATEVARTLEHLLSRGEGDLAATEAPFRGLLPFEERHAGFFFGRDAEVDAAVERLRVATFLPVVGPSGAGKSSFVQAGVLPRLRERGPLTVLSLRPGPHPLAVLAARLAGVDPQDSRSETAAQRDQAHELARHLLERPGQANVLLHRLADTTRTQVVLFVDQLEEAVTQGCAPEQARAFLDAVALAADAVDDQVRVIVTLRDDFLARLAVSPTMAQALHNLLVVRRLDDSLLREAAMGPLARLGYAWDDPSVVDRIVAELRGLPSALPLLQFACAALWDRRDQRRHVLQRADYEQLGGVAGALAAHAEAVFDGLAPADLDVARALLLRLVGPDGARRVVPRSQALEGLGAAGEALVERLTLARLLSVRRSRVAASGEAVIELTHDSLLRDWPQLRRWLDESSEERLLLAQVEDAARVWDGRGRQAREVWPLDGVLDARRRLRAEAVALSPVARAFLQLGEMVGRRNQRRRRIALAGLLVAALVITITSSVAAVAFARKERETQRQADLIARAAAERALAAADTGIVDLGIALFDWDEATGSPRAAALTDPRQLDVTLWEVDAPDAITPTRARAPQFVRWSAPKLVAGQWRAELQTRSGPVFVRVAGRQVGSQTCPPSWLKVLRLPGWSEREQGAKPVTLQVPTCQASRSDVRLVPAGPFMLGGEGDPPIPGHLNIEPEQTVHLPVFAIDRTERTNSWFQAFAGNHTATGMAMPRYPAHMREGGMAEPDRPVVAVDALTADSFCAWLGRTLPTREQWVKAGRGGLMLPDGTLNPLPRRNLPWGHGAPGPQFNLHREDDAWPFSAPVTADLQGASPYGVLGLVDNVSEWTSAAPQGDGDTLRVVVGGDWGDAWESGLHSLAVANSRSPRFFAFSLGFRCGGDLP